MNLPTESSTQLTELQGENRLKDVQLAEDYQAASPRFQVKLESITDCINSAHPDAETACELYADFTADRGRLSENSLKALTSVIRAWKTFAASRGEFAFPANEQTLISYFIQMNADKKSLNTMTQHRNQLEKIHKILRLDSAISSPKVLDFLDSIRRDLAIQRDSRSDALQAPPFKHCHLVALVRHHRENSHLASVMTKRDLALLVLAYATSMREDEIAMIRLDDLTINDDNSISIYRSKEKTQSGNLHNKLLNAEYGSVIVDYIDAASPFYTSYYNYLFCAVTSNGKKLLTPEKQLSSNSIDRIFERAFLTLHPGYKTKIKTLKEAGKTSIAKSDYAPNNTVWSGHSARVGSVVDAFENGESKETLRAMGGWSNDRMPDLYTRNAVRKKDPTIERLNNLTLD